MNKINLYKEFFIEKERTVFDNGNLKATLFKYSTGIEAVKVQNKRGYFILLPFICQISCLLILRIASLNVLARPCKWYG